MRSPSSFRNVLDSPPGITSPSMPSKSVRIADEHDVGAQLFQPAAVRVEISLQGKHTYLHDIWL